ncbi:MAG: hypothetical protein JWP89_5540 [Schlesneria sp.]|nr:hypothetical protein [Schlesneria sp.]
MREFFYGWRRKVGCLTLLMAMGLMGLWMRSRAMVEMILVRAGTRVHVALLIPGRVTWVSHRADTPGEDEWLQMPTAGMTTLDFEQIETDCRQDLAHSKQGYLELRMNLLAAIVPLTLLSAYLLLWNARKKLNRDA